MGALLTATDITKRYHNHTALDKVSIEVPQGQVFGLLGPNGAGKTSLIRIINQITAPDEGFVTFLGEPMKASHVEHIGYLPEERGLYKKMKVGEQAIYLAQLKGLSEQQAKKVLIQWFEKFDLMRWWNKKVEELSKGMQQKVQFIVTVIHNPRLLIFDEPFSGFDPINVNLLKEEILDLKKNGSTIIFSTHNMASVEELCDHITLINKSKNILSGQVSEIRKQYSENKFEVQLQGEHQAIRDRLQSIAEVVDENFTSGIFTLTLRLHKGIESNEILSALMPVAHIKGLRELLPGMNDIFIQSVTLANQEKA